MKTIRGQLLFWLFGGMLCATLMAGVATFLKVREETNDLFDYQLKQTAVSFPALMRHELHLPVEDEPDEDLVVQGWDRAGKLIFTSKTQPRLPHFSTPGYRTVAIDGADWRIYNHPANPDNGMLVQVAQPIHTRDELAAEVAMHSMLPFLALILSLAVLIWVVVGRSLRSLDRFAQALHARSTHTMHAMHALDTDGYPPELHPILDALNTLLAQLNQAMKLQRTFVADAAHELRTPLTALKLQLQLVERESAEMANNAGLKKLDERINRATHLVQQLLTLARHEDPTAATKVGALDLHTLATSVVSDFQPMAQARQIELELLVQEPHCTVTGQGDTLRIMLDNLVDNALRYTAADSHGQVKVVVGRHQGQPMLQVIDNGPGVASAERLRIFDRFYRGAHATETGSGLGLSIVKNIVEQHTGEILLHDAPAGPGLNVSIIFPLPLGLNWG